MHMENSNVKAATAAPYTVPRRVVQRRDGRQRIGFGAKNLNHLMHKVAKMVT